MNEEAGRNIVRTAGPEHVKLGFDHSRYANRGEDEHLLLNLHRWIDRVGIDLPFLPAKEDHALPPKSIPLSGQRESAVKRLKEIVRGLKDGEQRGFQVKIEKSRHHGTRGGKTIELEHYVISHGNHDSKEWSDFVRGIVSETMEIEKHKGGSNA